jgi:EmrB/QacA subfamily drug resistance transporter
MSKIDASIDSPHSFQQALLAMLGLCFVLIMVALDQTVIGTALPTIVADLHGFDLYAWVGTSYLLTSVITVPIFGKLGDEHGRKHFVVAAIVVFTVASMLCGAAQSMLQLVLARGLQGIGGGMLVATAFACIPDLFPDPRERLRWQILFSTSFGLANAIGPSLGGYLAQYWGWRWVFFVNLPVGLASLFFVWRHLPLIRHSDAPPSRMDWLGAALLALSLGSLQLVVEWLPQHKPVWLMLGLTAVGLGTGVGLVAWARRCSNPVLPLEMFSHAHLGPLFGLSLLMGFGMFALMYYAPLMFQGGFGLSPNAAGLLVTPLAVCITVGSIANGRIVMRLPVPNVMLYVGFILLGVSAMALSQTSLNTPHALIVGVMVVGGVGMGILLPNLTLFVQASAAKTQLGVATAMLQSIRMVGGMLGMALMGTLVSHRYAQDVRAMLDARHESAWSSWLSDPQILIDHAMASQFASKVSQAGLDPLVLLAGARQSLVDSIHLSQWGVVVLAAGGVCLARFVPHITLRQRAVPQESVHHD